MHLLRSNCFTIKHSLLAFLFMNKEHFFGSLSQVNIDLFNLIDMYLPPPKKNYIKFIQRIQRQGLHYSYPTARRSSEEHINKNSTRYTTKIHVQTEEGVHQSISWRRHHGEKHHSTKFLFVAMSRSEYHHIIFYRSTIQMI